MEWHGGKQSKRELSFKYGFLVLENNEFIFIFKKYKNHNKKNKFKTGQEIFWFNINIFICN